jgi:hypothetical protein
MIWDNKHLANETKARIFQLVKGFLKESPKNTESWKKWGK